MLPVSAKDVIRFTPPAYEGQENPPVFLLEVPTFRKRERWRDVVNRISVRHSEVELIQILRDGVEDGIVEPQKQEFLDYLDDYEAAATLGQPLGDDLGKRIRAIREDMMRNYQRYREAVADNQYHADCIFTVAVRLFLVGWENWPVTFSQDGDMVSDAAMDSLNERDAGVIGTEIIRHMNLTPGQAKNSGSPSSSPVGPETSTPATKPPTAATGKSTGKRTKRIRSVH